MFPVTGHNASKASLYMVNARDFGIPAPAHPERGQDMVEEGLCRAQAWIILLFLKVGYFVF